MADTKESKIFTYVYSASEERRVIQTKLSRREIEEIEKIRREYLIKNKTDE